MTGTKRSKSGPRYTRPSLALAAIVAAGATAVASAGTYTYTDQADWLTGVHTNTNSDEPPVGHVKLNDSILTPFNHIWVSLAGRDSVVRIDTNHVEADGFVSLVDSSGGAGAVLGEYLTRPNGMAGNPSRTTVDANGDVWVGNRNEAGVVAGVPMGSITKVSASAGGTTSTGIWNGSTFNRLDWSNAGGVDSLGGTSTATDDAILQYVRTTGFYVRHMSVDANNNVWAGGAPGAFFGGNQAFQLYDGMTGAAIPSSPGDTTSFDINRGGYGGLVDGNGVLWSAGLVENSMVRFDPATGIATPIDNGRQSYGMGIDGNGKVWVSNWDYDSIQRFNPDGTLDMTFTPAGMNNPRGVAVTPVDDDVWVANSYANTVSRLNNDGTLAATIPVGAQPTGVAVDANGKVWVTNLDSNSVMRIDPATNAVDLTVDLGPGASPYNYSDMTGTVLFGTTIATGTWRDVIDSGAVSTLWDDIFWNTEMEGEIPLGTSLLLEARVSNDQMTWSSYMSYVSGAMLSLTGRYLELRATFLRDVGVDDTAVLSDISVNFTRRQQVPEPGSLLLLGAGGIVLGLRRAHRHG